MTKFGITNITGNQTVVNQTQELTLQELFNKTGTSIGSNIAGSLEMSGVLLLIIASFGLYNNNVDTDAAAIALVPGAMLLGTQGLLPFGTSIVYSAIVGIAAVFAYGITSWAFS